MIQYKIYKFCPKCNDYFESSLQNPNRYCNIHQIHFEDDVKDWMKLRYIKSEFFDVYSRVYENNSKIGRICRICGSKLLTKNKKYSKRRRYCLECEDKKDNFLNKYHWNFVRDEYIKNLIKKQKSNNKFLKKINYKKRSIHTQSFFCEKCMKLINSARCEVHHRIPVSMLDTKTYFMCWIHFNLIALCLDCHHELKTLI